RLVATQGHVLRTPDFLSTLLVEITVHHLDLVVDLPAAAGPTAAGLIETRRVLEGLLGEPLLPEWDDTEVALRGTGRLPSDDPRLPLIG
ncbi:MAG TPA: hypothetical protein VFY76_18195, partial [Nocardioides sp.]|nr:hypothetical protein [Nocardioides sp.]